MKNTTEHILPESWAPALINGDYSGMTEEDADQVDAYLAQYCPGWCVSVSDEPEFRHRNDSGNNLAGDCLTYTFTK